MVDLTTRQKKKLGLDGKIEAQWDGPEYISIDGKSSFYYSGTLHNKLDLIVVHPAIFLIQETKIASSKERNSVRFDGELSLETIRQLDFTHYLIGQSYTQRFSQDARVYQFYRKYELILEIAPITFLKERYSKKKTAK